MCLAGCEAESWLVKTSGSLVVQSGVKNIPARFWEWLTEILRHGTVLGWAAEQFESESWNLAVMFLHNSVNLQNSCVAVFFPHPLKCNVSALSVCIISLRFWLRRPVSSRLCIVSLHHPSIHPSSFLWRRNNNEYPSFNCSIRHGDNWKRERRVESSWVKEVGLQHSSRVRDTERGTITSQKYQMNVY